MERFSKLIILVTAGIILSTATGYCSQNSNLRIENFNSSQGLINNHVLCITQDSRGLIWVGTYSGVQIFDGYTFHLIGNTPEGKELFSNHVIYSIAEDHDKKNMWFGTEFGLNSYNIITGKITSIVSDPDKEGGLSCNNIRDIYIDNDGLLWLGTYGGGLTVYNKITNEFVQYKAIPGDSGSLQSNFINSMYADRKGLLWIATEKGGITVFDMQKRKVVRNFLKGFNSINDDIVNCIFQDYYDNYWFGTWNGGLIKYTPQNDSFKYFECFPDGSENKKMTVRSIEQTDKDFLWLGTFGEGLYKFYIDDEKSEKCELVNAGLKNTKQGYIWEVIKDHKDNIWIATFGSGIFMINKDKNIFPSYALQEGPENKLLSITCFCEDSPERIWIGTYNAGLYIFNINDATYSKFNLDSRLNNSISCIYKDREKRIWIAYGYGLMVLMPDHKTYRFYEPDPKNPGSLSKSIINTILEDNEGNIWIGFWGDGINIITKEDIRKKAPEEVCFKKQFLTKNTSGSIPNKNIWKLQKDSKGNIWIATPDKLTYYDPQSNKYNSLEIYSVSSIYEDESGDIWLTAMGKGLCKLDKNYSIEKLFGLDSGLPSTTLIGVLPDKKRRLWIGTNKGISVLEPKTGHAINFERNYGLGFKEVALNAYTLLSSGNMVFGGNEGYTVFSPETIGQHIFQGRICIDDIKVMYKPIDLTDKNDSNSIRNLLITGLDTLVLDHSENILSLGFSAVNYSNPQEIKFAYRMEGVDNEWIVTDAHNRVATYANLSPGEYKFRVKASYNTMDWGSSTGSLFIIIKKPFWQQNWFKALIALLIMFIVYLFFRYWLNKEKRVLLLQNRIQSSQKLIEEQKLLRFQNEKLKESIHKDNSKIALLVYKNHIIDKCIKLVYSNLLDMKNDVSTKNESKLKQTIRNIEENTDGLFHKDLNIDTTVNILFDDFQKRMIQQYPKLTHKDLRICSYIRMNKSNKEIAQQLNITLGSLETSRYRLRKKLNLDSDVNLNDFILRV